MSRFEDLRFIIGLLFGVLGLLVLFATPGYKPSVEGAVNANLVGGIAMTVFAALMLGLALFSRPQDK